MDFARSLKVSEPELFSICREYYSEGIARVASVALYWSQFAQHQFRGKLGIYKTDDDLGKSIGRHPKTAGANLMKVCAPLGQSSRTDLFEVTYGPKAGQNGGRCRWLFVTPRGEQIIQVAREHRLIRSNAKRNRGVRHERRHESIDAPSSDSAARRSAAAVRSHRQPENTPTLYTEDLPTRRSVNLSAAPREISIEDSQERQEEEEEKINRISELWKVACERSGRRDLVWRPSDVRRFADEFLEIASMRTVRDLPEEDEATFLSDRHQPVAGHGSRQQVMGLSFVCSRVPISSRSDFAKRDTSPGLREVGFHRRRPANCLCQPTVL